VVGGWAWCRASKDQAERVADRVCEHPEAGLRARAGPVNYPQLGALGGTTVTTANLSPGQPKPFHRPPRHDSIASNVLDLTDEDSYGVWEIAIMRPASSTGATNAFLSRWIFTAEGAAGAGGGWHVWCRGPDDCCRRTHTSSGLRIDLDPQGM
jgi:hypothetical protein